MTINGVNRTDSLPTEDKKILADAAGLSQNIQQHVTNFYRIDETVLLDRHPFDFKPASPKTIEIALRRCVASSILDFINGAVKYGEESNLDNCGSQF